MILSCCFHNNDVWRNIFQISYKSINPPVSVNLLMYRFFWIVKAIKRILRNVNPNNTSPFYCSSHPCKYGLYAQATVRECHEMSGDLDFSASFELRPRIDLPLMLGPPLRGEVEFSHMTKDFFEWQYTRPRIVPYGTTPQKSRHGKPFLPSSLYTRKRSRSWGATVQDYREIFLRGHGSQTSTHYGTVEYEDISLLYEERTFVALFLFID